MRNIAIRKFDLHSNKQANPLVCLYIQINDPEISENDIDVELVYFLNRYDFFNRIIFAGKEANLKHLKESYFDSEPSLLKSRLERKTSNLDEDLSFLSYDESGKHNIYNLKWQCLIETCEQIQQDLLTYLFKKSNAFKLAPEGLHYVAPSKHHNNVFLRTSSVLEHPGNLSILLFWMLPFIYKKELTHIYVDTTGILPLGIALAYEVKNSGFVGKLPMTCSFKSYEGIDTLKINNAEKTLVLISASMSGGLGKQVSETLSNSEKLLLEKNTINLYLHNHRNDGALSLCVINRHPKHEQVFGVIENFSANECKLCDQGFIKTELYGDLFTIEEPKVNPITIVSKNLTDKNRKLLNQYTGIGFFKVYKHVSEGNTDLEIFLDVSKLFAYEGTLRKKGIDSFKNQWRKELLRSFTTNLKRIIYTPSPYSKDLANEALKEYKKLNTSNQPEIIAHNNINTENVEEHASSLVISACLDNARELAGINHNLRKLQPHGNVAYLSCVFRGSTEHHRRQVKSSLTYNNDRANDYDLYSVFNIDLPNCSYKNSWQKELDFLTKIEQWANADVGDLELPDKISERIDYLKSVPSTGMSEKLFWASPSDNQLKIQDGFVFIENSASSDLSQADIFVTMTMVLHALRNAEKLNEKLFSKPYHRAVLAPKNFTQFNDGVVQASLLRAARKDELNYTSSRANGKEMMEIICYKIEYWSASNSEALMEFLIALLTKSLILHPDDLKNICTQVNHSNDIPLEYKIITRYIQDTRL